MIKILIKHALFYHKYFRKKSSNRIPKWDVSLSLAPSYEDMYV